MREDLLARYGLSEPDDDRVTVTLSPGTHRYIFTMKNRAQSGDDVQLKFYLDGYLREYEAYQRENETKRLEDE